MFVAESVIFFDELKDSRIFFSVVAFDAQKWIILAVEESFLVEDFSLSF